MNKLFVKNAMEGDLPYIYIYIHAKEVRIRVQNEKIPQKTMVKSAMNIDEAMEQLVIVHL